MKFQKEHMLEDVLDFDLEIYAKKWFYITFSYIIESKAEQEMIKVQAMVDAS